MQLQPELDGATERFLIDGVDSKPLLRFDAAGTFEAFHAAERFAEQAGFSVGSGSADAPIALMFGDWLVAKWKNLTTKERAGVHGLIQGDRRNGPVTLCLTEKCPADGRTAFIAAASELSSLA